MKLLFIFVLCLEASTGFQPRRLGKTTTGGVRSLISLATSTTTTLEKQQADEVAIQKKTLLEWLPSESQQDPVLADPITKEPIAITTTSALRRSAR